MHESRGSSVMLGQEPEAMGPWPQEGGMVLNCCLQELFFFFRGDYQLQLRTKINGCISERFGGADENKVLC